MEVKAKRMSDFFFFFLCVDLLGFSDLCINIHDKINYKEEACEYQKYSNLLRNILAGNDKCELFFASVNFI